MNSQIIRPILNSTNSLPRCAHLSLMVIVALLTMSAGTTFAANSFAGRLEGVSITDAAKVNTPPTPILKYTSNGTVVTVDASASSDADGSISLYNWDFGDGTKATGITASHQYASTGSYPITLTIIDNVGGLGITQQEVALSTGFYWSVDTLPQTSIVSDGGNITISKYSMDATSSPGFKGNCMQQTGTNQAYKIPMITVPEDKGVIRMYVRHDNAADSTDTANRYFFKSTNTAGANALYAYTYKGNIYFYMYDSAGTLHRVYGQANWQVGQWHLYEFIWDATTGVLTVQKDGTTLLKASTPAWTSALPSWTGQDLFFGYINPIGSIDEISITK